VLSALRVAFSPAGEVNEPSACFLKKEREPPPNSPCRRTSPVSRVWPPTTSSPVSVNQPSPVCPYWNMREL